MAFPIFSQGKTYYYHKIWNKTGSGDRSPKPYMCVPWLDECCCFLGSVSHAQGHLHCNFSSLAARQPGSQIHGQPFTIWPHECPLCDRTYAGCCSDPENCKGIMKWKLHIPCERHRERHLGENTSLNDELGRWRNALGNKLTVVIISQHTWISNQYVVHFKLIQYCTSTISKKPGGKNKCFRKEATF